MSLPGALDRYHPRRRQLAAWAAREPVLAGLGFDELRAGLLDPALDIAVKDERLVALVRLARTDPDAVTTIAACLVPALTTIAGRSRRSLGADAWPAVVAALCAEVRRYQVELRPSWVARNLCRATNARVAAMRRREDRWAARTSSLSAGPVLAATGEVTDGGLLGEAVRAGVVAPTTAGLIALTRVAGHPLASAARRLGLGYEAAKKRRQRGEAALAAWLTAEPRSVAA